jgi:hypothetical protein
MDSYSVQVVASVSGIDLDVVVIKQRTPTILIANLINPMSEEAQSPYQGSKYRSAKSTRATPVVFQARSLLGRGMQLDPPIFQSGDIDSTFLRGLGADCIGSCSPFFGHGMLSSKNIERAVMRQPTRCAVCSERGRRESHGNEAARSSDDNFRASRNPLKNIHLRIDRNHGRQEQVVAIGQPAPVAYLPAHADRFKLLPHASFSTALPVLSFRRFLGGSEEDADALAPVRYWYSLLPIDDCARHAGMAFGFLSSLLLSLNFPLWGAAAAPASIGHRR